MSREKEKDLALIGKERKGGKKMGLAKSKEEETSFNFGAKDWSHVNLYKCHKKGHSVNQCHEKRKGKGK